MSRLKLEDLSRIKNEIRKSVVLESGKTSARITVHMGTCGISSGAGKVLEKIKEEVESCGREDIAITTSGCAGICNREPIITVERAGEEPIKYAEVDQEKAQQIFQQHVIGGKKVAEWVFAKGIK